MPSGESVKIAATNPNLANTNDCLPGGEYGYGCLSRHKLSRSAKHDLSHKHVLPLSLTGDNLLNDWSSHTTLRIIGSLATGVKKTMYISGSQSVLIVAKENIVNKKRR